MTSISVLTQNFLALDSFGSTLNFFLFYYKKYLKNCNEE